METVLAIDPGNVESAYAFLEDAPDGLVLGEFAKRDNAEVLELARNANPALTVVIEMIASYGMPVGREVFDTCVFIGRLSEAMRTLPVHLVYRRDVKLNLCNSVRAKDTNVRQALIDRYAQHDFKNGRGTKKNPDFFYGVSRDCWAAIAAGVTYIDAAHAKLLQPVVTP